MDSDVPTEGLNDEPDEPLRRHLERDPGQDPGPDLEGSAAYERAVEEDDVLPASETADPGAGELAPEFREPGQPANGKSIT